MDMAAATVPSLASAARFWARLGFISFGGPAGQIALMHREIVDRRRWLDDVTFTHALNFCMLLPGPEALQLAIFLGWRMHGIRGGLLAGLGFILPAIVLLFALSVVYVYHGSLPWIAGVLFGLKAAVVAIVAQALVRIGRRALGRPLHVALALGAFVTFKLFATPFPLVLLVAALVGAWDSRGQRVPATMPVAPRATSSGHTVLVAAVGLALWLVPWLLLAPTVGVRSLWAEVYLFFTKAALVTFGGAYAVLGYVTEHLVEDLHWLTAQQSVAGLALAESTPGPLVIVLQFMGFMTGWNQPSPLPALAAALCAGALASWATFLPSFVFIFLGAPHVERLTRVPTIGGALAAITAAVVGIIAALALLLAQVVVFPDGWLAWPDWRAAALVVGAWWALERTRWPLVAVLVASAVLGLILQALHGLL